MSIVSIDADHAQRDALDVADLTVLVGLVRRAKTGAEKRWQKRKHLNQGVVGGDPCRTKVNKLGRLLSKLEELRSQAQ